MSNGDHAHPVRQWESTDGKFNAWASYVGIFQQSKVKMRKAESGLLIAVPLALLCAKDRAYVEEQAHLANLSSVDPLSLSPSISSEDVSIGGLVASSLTTNRPSSGKPTPSPQQQPYALSAVPTVPTVPTVPAEPRPPARLDSFPNQCLNQIAAHLDAFSRVRFGATSRQMRRVVLQPAVWSSVRFDPQDIAHISDPTIEALIQWLLRLQLCYVVRSLDLSGSGITFKTIVIVLTKMGGSLSLLTAQSCPRLQSFPLAVALLGLVRENQTSISLQQLSLGTAITRGLASEKDRARYGIDSRSIGEDVAVISSALNALARRPVAMDCFPCEQCKAGVATNAVRCVVCGPIPIKRCTACAPQCERCMFRLCGLGDCQQKTAMRISVLPCAGCDQSLTLCSHPRQCINTRPICPSCGLRYHAACRSKNGLLQTNTCVVCRHEGCPFCTLTHCEGGCRRAWCTFCSKEEVSLTPCKCIVLHSSRGAQVSMRKRNVCRRCRVHCPQCLDTGFCARCLAIHIPTCKT